MAVVSKVYLIKNNYGRSRGYGYVQFSNGEGSERALTYDRKLKVGTRPIYVSSVQVDKIERAQKFRTAKNPDCCLYVSNLCHTVTEEELTEAFSQYSGFKEARLATYRNGHSKGFAYIEFERNKEASSALIKEDGAIFHGQAISIHISSPPQKQIPVDNPRRSVVNFKNAKKGFLPSKKMSNDDFRILLKK